MDCDDRGPYEVLQRMGDGDWAKSAHCLTPKTGRRALMTTDAHVLYCVRVSESTTSIDVPYINEPPPRLEIQNVRWHQCLSHQESVVRAPKQTPQCDRTAVRVGIFSTC